MQKFNAQEPGPDEEAKADGAVKPSLRQKAEQEAKQKGTWEAARRQEGSLGPRAQPVAVTVQQHQDHSIGPAKPFRQRHAGGVWIPTQGLWSRQPPGGSREHSHAPCGPHRGRSQA